MIGAVRPHLTSPDLDGVQLRIHGLDIGVRSDVPTVIDTVTRSYGAFLVDGDGVPGDAWIDTRSSGDGETTAILGTLDRIVARVIDGLGERGILGTHAAAVTIDDRAVVLAGRSGAGKSTLTLALLRDGARLLTDELTLICPDDQTILPYPRALHVSPATVALLPELAFLLERPRQALGSDAEWSVSMADLARGFGTTIATASRLASIVVLDERGDPADEPRIEPLTGAQAALELARGTPAAARDFSGTLARLASIAGSVTSIRLRATDVGRTASLLRDHVAVAR